MWSGVRDMKIFLAGIASPFSIKTKKYAFYRFTENRGINWLDSYFYLRNKSSLTAEWFKNFRNSEKCREFLLDSGAFTFMTGGGKNENIEDYIEGYCNYINTEKIDKFFELDIDSILGYEKVLEIRDLIEKKTGKKCIPVWHPSRGIDEFKQMCQDYEFVSIGGIAAKEMAKEKVKKIAPPLCRYAHRQGCRIHALGIGKPFGGLHDFDSYDSTNWSSGVRYGTSIAFFNGHDIIMKKIDTNMKGKWDRQMDQSIKEWMKYADYIEFDYKAGI